MTLEFRTDVSAADWIAGADRPWDQLVTFGPPGFEAYARLRFLPDPQFPGQSENDVDGDDWRDEQFPRLFAALAARTADPDDCYFCVWEGFGTATTPTDEPLLSAGELAAFALARPGLAPPGPPTVTAPQVVVPHRAFWLFHGGLADLGTWDTAAGWPGEYSLDDAEAAFVWPADRSWCVTKDVDPHFATVAGPAALIAALRDVPGLDLADLDAGQVFYR